MIRHAFRWGEKNNNNEKDDRLYCEHRDDLSPPRRQEASYQFLSCVIWLHPACLPLMTHGRYEVMMPSHIEISLTPLKVFPTPVLESRLVMSAMNCISLRANKGVAMIAGETSIILELAQQAFQVSKSRMCSVGLTKRREKRLMTHSGKSTFKCHRYRITVWRKTGFKKWENP